MPLTKGHHPTRRTSLAPTPKKHPPPPPTWGNKSPDGGWGRSAARSSLRACIQDRWSQSQRGGKAACTAGALTSGRCWVTGIYLQLLGSYWRLRAVTRSYGRLLAVTGSYGRLLAVTGSYWQVLAVAVNYGQLPTDTSSYWQILAVTGGYRQVQMISGRCGRLLAVVGCYRQLLAVTGGYPPLPPAVHLTCSNPLCTPCTSMWGFCFVRRYTSM